MKIWNSVFKFTREPARFCYLCSERLQQQHRLNKSMSASVDQTVGKLVDGACPNLQIHPTTPAHYIGC